MSNLGQKLKHELKELVPVTLFFFVAFQLLAFTRVLMLEQYGIKITTFATAALMALVVAKVVVIADHFKLVNRFPHHPLLYNIVWKSAIYFIASFAVHYGEHVIPLWRKTGSFAKANDQLFDEVVWPHFWGVQMWLLIMLLTFCTIRELVRAIGRARMIEMFFIQGGPERETPPPGADSSPVNH